MGVLIWLVTFLILVSSAAAAVCDRCVHRSEATYYNDSKQASSGGACGYGTHFNVRHFAGAPKSIFMDGIGCSRCYQVRCMNGTICSKGGVNVTVTSVITKQKFTAFVLSEAAFMAMAKNIATSKTLPGLGTVQVQYKSVPCDYGNKNLMIWVEDSSNKDKKYLAIKFLYKEGQTDIVAVKVAAVEKKIWVSMIRYGATWYTIEVPTGALKFQFEVTSKTKTGCKTYATNDKYGLPDKWKQGMEYDSGLQFNDVAQDKNCATCDNTIWK